MFKIKSIPYGGLYSIGMSNVNYMLLKDNVNMNLNLL